MAGMSTGAKIAIGVSVLAGLGGLAYALSEQEASPFPLFPLQPTPSNTNGAGRQRALTDPAFDLGPIPGFTPPPPPPATAAPVRPDRTAAVLPSSPREQGQALPPAPLPPPPSGQPSPTTSQRPSKPSGTPSATSKRQRPLPSVDEGSGKKTPARSSTSTDETSESSETAPGLESSPSTGPFELKASLLAGATERRHAAGVVVEKPETFPPRDKTRGGKDLGDWLADVAYWSAYPDGPTAIDPKNRSHKKYVDAWVRLRAYVGRGLTLEPKLGLHPINPNAPQVGHENWRRWALAVAFSSELRTADVLRSAYPKAWHYIMLDPAGVQWQTSLVKKRISGLPITLEGLMADASVYLSRLPKDQAHRELLKWPETATKAFASANQTARTLQETTT